MTVVSDNGKSILFKGRFIKSVNQYFMKKKGSVTIFVEEIIKKIKFA